MKNIVITGGAGYVGAVLVPKLLKKKYRVTVVDWFIYGDVFKDFATNPNLIQLKGDIRDTALLKKNLVSCDAVIHLACISNDPSFELNPALGKSINYDATVQLTDVAKAAGVKRFIYASSSSVYGVKKEAQVTESLPLEPLTDYSKYKALSEKYILRHNSPQFTALVLRPATVCGYSPRLRLDLAVNILAIQALVNKKITVFGGTQLRPNIHIEDMTDLYVKTLEYPEKKIAGKIFNAGYDNYSLLDIAHMVKRVVGDETISIDVLPSKDLRSYKISSRKIKRELRFTPRHTVEDAIADLATAYKKGLIPDALTNPRYYNIKLMQQRRIS
jgi:nucleoside-diphosphate-sugar epimerase